VKKALQIAALFVLKKGNSIILVRYGKRQVARTAFFLYAAFRIGSSDRSVD
jgi:hypothetical protein